MKLIKDCQKLLVNITALEKETFKEIAELEIKDLIWDLNKERDLENPILIENELEDLILEKEFFKEERLLYKFSADFKIADLRGKEVELLVRLRDFETLVLDLIQFRKESALFFDKEFRLANEIEKLKQDREQKELDFTNKIKQIEAKLGQELATALKRKTDEALKRFEDDKEDLKLYGAQAFFSDFLPHFLTLKLVVQSASQITDSKVKGYLQGFDMVVRSMSDSLSNFGISEIIPKVGDLFDPNIHTGDSTISDEKLPSGAIAEVKFSGFKLHQRLLIPAVVVVNEVKDTSVT